MGFKKSVLLVFIFLVLFSGIVNSIDYTPVSITPVCYIKLNGQQVITGETPPSGTCSASCYDSSQTIPGIGYLLKSECYEIGEYKFEYLTGGEFHNGETSFGGCSTTSTTQNYYQTVCTLPTTASGGTPDTNGQKCLANVREGVTGNDMTAISIAEVYKGENSCCGWGSNNNLAHTFNQDMCLLPDGNYDAIMSIDGDWKYRPASTNTFHVYNIKKSELNYDVISNGDNWYKCGDVIDPVNNADKVLQGGSPAISSLTVVDDNSADWGDGDVFYDGGTTTGDFGSYANAFQGIQINSIGGFFDSNTQDYTETVTKYSNDLLEDMRENSQISPMGSESFMCMHEPTRDIFLECCAFTTADNGECINYAAKDRARRQGEPSSLLSDMNEYDISGKRVIPQDNRIMKQKVQARNFNNELVWSFKRLLIDDLKHDFYITDWSEYTTLEFYMAHAGNANIAFYIEDVTGKKIWYDHIMDYSVNGQEPLRFHHIIIPLKNIGLDRSKIKDLGWVPKNDYYSVLDKERVKYNSNYYYNVFFLDRIYLKKTDDKFCTGDHKWSSDLDDDEFACMETPGYFWTKAGADELSNGQGPCCGDDQTRNEFRTTNFGSSGINELNELNELFSGGRYAGCWYGRPVYNDTLIGNLELNIEGDGKSLDIYDWCTSDTCYLSLPSYAEKYTLKNVLQNPNSIYNISFTNEAIGSVPQYFVDGNDLVTEHKSQQIVFKGVSLPFLYSDKEFHACETEFPGSNNNLGQRRDYCDIQGSYFCSYGDPRFGEALSPSWSMNASGTAQATDRNVSQHIGDLDYKNLNFGDGLREYKPDSCCPQTYCWNGTTCVEGITEVFGEVKYEGPLVGDKLNKFAFSNVFGYENKSNDFDMYICVKEADETGNYISDWQEAFYKETWGNSTFGLSQSEYTSSQGYCLEDSQCWTGVECVNSSWYTYKESDTTYTLAGDNNPTSEFGDHYCDNGTWTSRTKMIAERLINLVNNRNAGDDYSLYCGPYEGENSVLNYLEYETDHPVLNYFKNSEYNSGYEKHVNNFCVLKYKNDGSDEYDIAVGVSLNQHITEYPEFTRAFESDFSLKKFRPNCDVIPAIASPGVYTIEDVYDQCDQKRFWYNYKTRSFIFSSTNIPSLGLNPDSSTLLEIFFNFFANPAEAVNDLLRRVIQPVVGMFVVSKDIIEDIKNFDIFYLSEIENKQVFGVNEEVKLGEQVLNVNFYNFTTNMCESIEKYYERESNSFVLTCEPVIKNREISYHVYTSLSTLFNDWREITGKFRTQDLDRNSLPVPKSKILFPVNGTVVYSKSLAELEAKEDESVQSYYWDLNSSDVINGQFFGRKVETVWESEGKLNISLITINKQGKYNVTTIEICVDDLSTTDINFCDPDIDKDEILNLFDNCPLIPNPLQLNTDLDVEQFLGFYVLGKDILGDVCDDDDDNDGILDIDDDFPLDASKCSDFDNDGCDDCSGIRWQVDYNYLSIGAVTTRIVDSFGKVRNKDATPKGSEIEADTDNDGQCDFSDDDNDGDNVPDPEDCFINITTHLPQCDVESFDTDPDNCGDRDNDGCDDCSFSIIDLSEWSPGDWIKTDGPDYDDDGLCDYFDADIDIDGDGVPNDLDKDDNNRQICSDVDNDGCDDCSGLDGQGLLEKIIYYENQRVNSTLYGGYESAEDYDKDGLCDKEYATYQGTNRDLDEDNDGVNDAGEFDIYLNTFDPQPHDAQLCGDIDGDGCNDCSAVGYNITDINGDVNDTILNRRDETMPDGERRVKNYLNGGSELESDYDDDGICDDYDNYVPVVIQFPSGLTNTSTWINVTMNEMSVCNASYNGDLVMLNSKSDEFSFEFNVEQEMSLRLNDCSFDVGDFNDTYNLKIGLAYSNLEYCNKIDDLILKTLCTNGVYYSRASVNDDILYCDNVVPLDIFDHKIGCESFYNVSLDNVCAAPLINKPCNVCNYFKVLKGYDNCQDILNTDGEECDLFGTCLLQTDIEIMRFLSESGHCPSINAPFNLILECHDMSKNVMVPYTIELVPDGSMDISAII